MQVPASTTAPATSPDDLSGSPSTVSAGSPFSQPSEDRMGKKSSLTAFAAILAQHSGTAISGLKQKKQEESVKPANVSKKKTDNLYGEISHASSEASAMSIEGSFHRAPTALEKQSGDTHLPASEVPKIEDRKVKRDYRGVSPGTLEKMPETNLPDMAQTNEIAVPVPSSAATRNSRYGTPLQTGADSAQKPDPLSSSTISIPTQLIEAWDGRIAATVNAEKAIASDAEKTIASDKQQSLDRLGINPGLEGQNQTNAKEVHAPEATASASGAQAHTFSQASIASSNGVPEAKRTQEPNVKKVKLEVPSSPIVEGHTKTEAKTNADAARFLPSPLSGIVASDSLRANTDTTTATQLVHAGTIADVGTRRETPAAFDANTFQHLDSGDLPATLLHSGAHSIAVGVHDPSLGWLEVQTQSVGGHLSATLTAASTDAHASLSAQSPAITQYLSDRNISVHNLHVHTQGEATAGGGGAQAGSGNPRQETTGQNRHLIAENQPPIRQAKMQYASAPATRQSSRISVRA